MKQNHKPGAYPELTVSKTVISSRSTADIYFDDQIIRVSGELCMNYFLADPYTMIRIEESDLGIWPWQLSAERQRNHLSDEKMMSCMAAVRNYCRNSEDLIVFLTREFEDRAFQLADMVSDRKISKLTAIQMLKDDFPEESLLFCKDEIETAISGYRWHTEKDPQEENV